MKKILLAFLALFPVSLMAQWVQTNGPRAGIIYSMIAKDSLIFAGTENGIYITSDNGAHWNSSSTNPISFIYSFAVSDSNIYAGLQSGNIYKSSDNGGSWIPVNNGLPVNSQVKAMITMGSLVFAGFNSKGIYLSTDQGISWDSANTGLNSIGVTSFVVMDSAIFAGTSTGGVSMSIDSGASWTQINNGIGTYITALEVKDTNLFAGTNGGGMYRYSISANQWTQVNNGIDMLNISDVLSSGNDLYASSSFIQGRIYYSNDNANSWTRIDSALNGTYILSLAKSNTHLFAGTNYCSAFTTTNNGTTWVPASEGLPHAIVFSVLADGNKIFAGTWRNGIHVTTDYGFTWSLMNAGFPSNESVYDLEKNGDTLYAGTEHKGVYRSYDHGNTWLPSDSLPPGVTDVHTVEVINGKIFGGCQTKGAIISYDNGRHWQQIINGFGYQYTTVYEFVHLGSKVFAATDRTVYSTINDGANWVYSGTGLPNDDYRAIIADGSYLYAASFSNGIYLSIDSGNTWNLISGSLIPFVHELMKINSTLYVGCVGGVIYTNDTGATWINMTGINTNTDAVVSLETDGTFLYAGSFNGVFTTSTLMSSNGYNDKLSELVLFPNPSTDVVNWSSTIDLDFIRIFSTDGKLIKELNSPDTDGSFSTADFPKGIYFVNVQTSNRQYFKKLMLD